MATPDLLDTITCSAGRWRQAGQQRQRGQAAAGGLAIAGFGLFFLAMHAGMSWRPTLTFCGVVAAAMIGKAMPPEL